MTTETENQIPFDLKVLRLALNEVVSEEDAESLAKILVHLTEASDAWGDATLLEGEQLSLKILICFEVMRSMRKQMEQADHTLNETYIDERCYANVFKAIRGADAVLSNDEAWQDFVKFTSKDFQEDLLRSLETRLAKFKELGPVQDQSTK